MLLLNVFKIAIASVWLYQGLWCKLLGRAPHHREIVERTSLVNAGRARHVLAALGVFECVLAGWVLSGIRPREAALAQTVLLAGMNAVALVRARSLIPDPIGMMLQNWVFLLAAWVAAGQVGGHAS